MGFWISFLKYRRTQIAAVLALLNGGCSSSEMTARVPESRVRLPQVMLIGCDRRPTELAEVTRGRPALISLWATWCDSCVREFAALNRLHVHLAGEAVVIGV